MGSGPGGSGAPGGGGRGDGGGGGGGARDSAYGGGSNAVGGFSPSGTGAPSGAGDPGVGGGGDAGGWGWQDTALSSLSLLGPVGTAAGLGIGLMTGRGLVGRTLNPGGLPPGRPTTPGERGEGGPGGRRRIEFGPAWAWTPILGGRTGGR